jgi:PTH1 family peptidyl-tRNA hydrolase
MKLIVGLGNPGSTYRDSRHNIGFSVIKEIAKAEKIVLKKDINVVSGKGKIEGQNIILAMPLTFMNLSGAAVTSLFKKYKIELDSLLIVCDDLDLELGRIKIRPSGSSGGHRGLKSIIDCLGTNSFPRLRLGISRPGSYVDAAEYVLSPFTKRENKQIKDTIKRASDCCRVWLIEGMTESMNIFNTRSKQ